MLLFDSETDIAVYYYSAERFHFRNRMMKSIISCFLLSRRVSIIRGRVITMSGQGIIGVRVSVDRTRDATNYGFTLTRPGGWSVSLYLKIIFSFFFWIYSKE